MTTNSIRLFATKEETGCNFCLNRESRYKVDSIVRGRWLVFYLCLSCAENLYQALDDELPIGGKE